MAFLEYLVQENQNIRSDSMSQASFASTLTKSKKDEIRRTAKKILESQGQSYDDWLVEQEFDIVLENIGNLSYSKPYQKPQ